MMLMFRLMVGHPVLILPKGSDAAVDGTADICCSKECQKMLDVRATHSCLCNYCQNWKLEESLLSSTFLLIFYHCYKLKAGTRRDRLGSSSALRRGQCARWAPTLLCFPAKVAAESGAAFSFALRGCEAAISV